MNAPDTHLLVDGHNVVHAWQDLKALVKRGGMEAACRLLVERLRVIHDLEGLRLTIVFDGRGEHIEVERPGDILTFSVLYTADGLSADCIIEQLLQRRRRGSTYWVASGDNMIAEAARAGGALAISPDELLAWVQRCDQRRVGEINRLSSQNTQLWQAENPLRNL